MLLNIEKFKGRSFYRNNKFLRRVLANFSLRLLRGVFSETKIWLINFLYQFREKL